MGDIDKFDMIVCYTKVWMDYGRYRHTKAISEPRDTDKRDNDEVE